MKVLLVVDVQNDFCPGGALAIEDGDKVVPVINDLIERGGYDVIIFTGDRHNLSHVSFAVNHQVAPFSEIEIDGKKRTVWPTHCVEESWGAQFHPHIKSERASYVVIKGDHTEYDSLSAFCDLDQTHYTELSEILDREAAARGETRSQVRLSVTGLAFDICAGMTACDGARLGYQTEIIYDACRAVNNDVEFQKSLLQDFKHKNVEVVMSHERLPEREIAKNIQLSA